jgi:hypothetical protein
LPGQLFACWGTYFPDTTDDAGCVGEHSNPMGHGNGLSEPSTERFGRLVGRRAFARPAGRFPWIATGVSRSRSNHCAWLSCHLTGSRHAMWKIGCVIAVSLLCGCTDAVYMRNASGETVKCGSVYTGLAGDFELMGIAARESQCIQDYKDQGFIRVPSAG